MFAKEEVFFILERTTSVEERIKRAEEIYQRRKNKAVRVSGNTVNIGNRPSFSLFKKMIYKIVACIIIYVVLYIVKNSNYIFSADLIHQTSHILSYDMNIQNMYNHVLKYFENVNINEFINVKNDENVETENTELSGEKSKEENEKITENNDALENQNEIKQTEEDTQSKTDENNDDNTKDTYEGENNNSKEENSVEEENISNNKIGGIGGADEEVNIQNNEQINQMEADANFLKNNFDMAVPVNGTITSKFGTRTPTDIISANHAGIDIGAYEDTKIIAAMDGEVTLVSGVGDYGNHVKIENGNISTLYAHCKEIYVKEGEKVKKGTEIATVGATGRATRKPFAF